MYVCDSFASTGSLDWVESFSSLCPLFHPDLPVSYGERESGCVLSQTYLGISLGVSYY